LNCSCFQIDVDEDRELQDASTPPLIVCRRACKSQEIDYIVETLSKKFEIKKQTTATGGKHAKRKSTAGNTKDVPPQADDLHDGNKSNSAPDGKRRSCVSCSVVSCESHRCLLRVVLRCKFPDRLPLIKVLACCSGKGRAP